MDFLSLVLVVAVLSGCPGRSLIRFITCHEPEQNDQGQHGDIGLAGGDLPGRRPSARVRRRIVRRVVQVGVGGSRPHCPIDFIRSRTGIVLHVVLEYSSEFQRIFNHLNGHRNGLFRPRRRIENTKPNRLIPIIRTSCLDRTDREGLVESGVCGRALSVEKLRG